MNPLFQSLPTSIFAVMSTLAIEHKAVNLGQGFPDFGWPDAILEAAARALVEGSNQYAPSRGLPQLRSAVADHYNRHFGQALDAEGICVTSGATEALSAFRFVDAVSHSVLIDAAGNEFARFSRDDLQDLMFDLDAISISTPSLSFSARTSLCVIDPCSMSASAADPRSWYPEL